MAGQQLKRASNPPLEDLHRSLTPLHSIDQLQDLAAIFTPTLFFWLTSSYEQVSTRRLYISSKSRHKKPIATLFVRFAL